MKEFLRSKCPSWLPMLAVCVFVATFWPVVVGVHATTLAASAASVSREEAISGEVQGIQAVVVLALARDPSAAMWSSAVGAEASAFTYDELYRPRWGVVGAGRCHRAFDVVNALSGGSVKPRFGARATSTTPSTRTKATNIDDTTRVGRWMSPDEHSAMVNTGQVQVGRGNTTYVASPAKPEAYMSQAAPGSHYVEFDVPSSSLRPAGQPGWSQIPTADNTMWGKLAPQRGWSVPESPVPACNIVHVATKLSC
jgi:hypothetical protein